MQVRIDGKQMDVGEALTKHVEEKIKDRVTKYFANAVEVHITFEKNPHKKVECDITVHPVKDVVLRAEKESGEDAYQSFETALNKIETQLRRAHERLKGY